MQASCSLPIAHGRWKANKKQGVRGADRLSSLRRSVGRNTVNSTKGCMKTISILASQHSLLFFTMKHKKIILFFHTAGLLELFTIWSKLHNISSYIFLKAINYLAPTSSFPFCEPTEASTIFLLLFAHTVNHKVCISQKMHMNLIFFLNFLFKRKVLLSTTEPNIMSVQAHFGTANESTKDTLKKY